MSPSAILNSRHWRKRAEQMRTLADDMNDLIARTAMLQIANDYDHMYPFREYAEVGGLIISGANLGVLFERAAGYVDRILRGEKPGDLPVQQATEFELIINLKAATALGLSVSPTLLARADEVIE